MTSSAVPYGALELKRVAQRYWMLGFLISVVLHCSLLGVVQFRLLTSADWRIPTDTHLNPHQFRPPERMLNFGIIEPQALPGVRHAIPKVDGAPVPAPESVVPKDQTIRSQEERVLEVSPGATGEVTATAGTGTNIKTEDPDPNVFIPVETFPQLVSHAIPVYPEAARLAGLEGKVFVKILVGTDGKPRKVIVENSTLEIFNEAATEAAMKFVFTPGCTSGGPVPVWVSVPFVFRLR